MPGTPPRPAGSRPPRALCFDSFIQKSGHRLLFFMHAACRYNLFCFVCRLGKDHRCLHRATLGRIIVQCEGMGIDSGEVDVHSMGWEVRVCFPVALQGRCEGAGLSPFSGQLTIRDGAAFLGLTVGPAWLPPPRPHTWAPPMPCAPGPCSSPAGPSPPCAPGSATRSRRTPEPSGSSSTQTGSR
jgi:hypothetical protein